MHMQGVACLCRVRRQDEVEGGWLLTSTLAPPAALSCSQQQQQQLPAERPACRVWGGRDLIMIHKARQGACAARLGCRHLAIQAAPNHPHKCTAPAADVRCAL